MNPKTKQEKRKERNKNKDILEAIIAENSRQITLDSKPQIREAQEYQAGQIPKYYTQAYDFQTTESRGLKKYQNKTEEIPYLQKSNDKNI